MDDFDTTACSVDTLPSVEELGELYAAVGWGAYTRDLEALAGGSGTPCAS